MELLLIGLALGLLFTRFVARRWVARDTADLRDRVEALEAAGHEHVDGYGEVVDITPQSRAG